MSHPSFRSLLKSLDVSQIESYLIDNGWSRTGPIGSTGHHYILKIEGTDRVYELSLPTDQARDKFVDRLYRLVFHVSCIEDREPMEVAGDMGSRPRLAIAAGTASVCITTVLQEELSHEDAFRSEQTAQRVIQELGPAIARAEFFSAGFGGASNPIDTMRMKAAIILVPVAKQLDVLGNERLAACVVGRIANRIFQVESVRSDPVLRDLFLTLRADSEDAPRDSLRALQQLY